MYNVMKEETLNFICNIFSTLSQEELNNHHQIAKSNEYFNPALKTHMDKLYGPPWHCIVGKGFGSGVTYKNNHFLYIYIMNKAIMIFKHWLNE